MTRVIMLLTRVIMLLTRVIMAYDQGDNCL